MQHGTSTTTTSAGNSKAPSSAADEAGVVKCPRCDSTDTKFCYYNNYSMAQPRHFCRTCRRYWTKGGSIRNVPIGGGCRKNKKLKSATDVVGEASLTFFQRLPQAMDFQLASLSSPPPFPRLHQHLNHHFSPELAPSPSWFGVPDASGNNYGPVLSDGIQEMMSYSNSFNIASSTIESWSCMNQDLHWKLQQQRLALLSGNGGSGGGDNDHKHINNTENSLVVVPHDRQQQKLLEPASEVCSGSDAATEWFFGNSYTNYTTTGDGGAGNGNDVGQPTTMSSWNNGFEAWSDDNHQFSTALFNLP